MVVKDSSGYAGSRDYARLAELAKVTSVICIVDFEDMRDVAQTIYTGDSRFDCWYVSARGHCYASSTDLKSFIARCTKVNLEFLEPDMERVVARLTDLKNRKLDQDEALKEDFPDPHDALSVPASQQYQFGLGCTIEQNILHVLEKCRLCTPTQIRGELAKLGYIIDGTQSNSALQRLSKAGLAIRDGGWKLAGQTA
jgi:hypothetical protein